MNAFRWKDSRAVDLLKSGGALVVGFSLAEVPSMASAARGECRRPRQIRMRSTPGSRSMPITPRPSISESASSAMATPPACCRSRPKSSTSR